MKGERKTSPLSYITRNMTSLDFYIFNQLNPKRILFWDTSSYSKTPTDVILSIKFPDFKKEYSMPIQFGTTTSINTAAIGFTDCVVDFPDGIYEFTLAANNGTCVRKEKVYIITQALVKLDKMVQDVNLSNKDLLEKHAKINLFLHGAQANVCVNENQAEANYKQAWELLKCM